MNSVARPAAVPDFAELLLAFFAEADWMREAAVLVILPLPFPLDFDMAPFSSHGPQLPVFGRAGQDARAAPGRKTVWLGYRGRRLKNGRAFGLSATNTS